MSLRIDMLERENSRLEREIAANRITSYRQKLLRQGRAISILAALQISWCIPFTHHMGMPMWYGIVLALYFLMVSLMSIRLQCHMERIDFGRMSAEKVAECVCRYIKLRRIFRTITACVAVPIIGYMFYCLWLGDESEAVVGCLIGVVVGLIIGLLVNRKTMSYVRAIEASL